MLLSNLNLYYKLRSTKLLTTFHPCIDTKVNLELLSRDRLLYPITTINISTLFFSCH